MSGGGSNGAWEAGVIYELLHSDNAAEYDWNAVTGVSAGAINAAFLSVFDSKDGVNASEWLV